MYLKKLEIQGFKSLADKIELEFNQGISAVVGPNGSGKSNIADAVRWVLGEQSIKSLRGAKMEDVIFSGSDKRKPVGMAEVAMTLDNSMSVFPLDYSEITVTRRVYRSGESEYLINKSACRLRDIHELFMDTGIGREGYSIIGQGKIEEILSAKSEDRRVIIEEAAGIVKYKTRKMLAVKKLGDTEQNLVRINDIITELETQVGPLEEQAKKAGEYLGYKGELVDLEVNLLINLVEDQKAKLAEICSQDDSLNRQIIETETVLRNLESGVEGQKLQLNKLDEEITDLQKSVYETGSLIEKSEAEIMVARERQKGLENQKENLQKEISDLKAKEIAERAQHTDDEKSLEDLKRKIASEEKELAVIEKKLSQIEAGLLSDQQKVEDKKAEIIDLLNDMAAVNNSINAADIEKQNLIRRTGQLEQQQETLAGELLDSLRREKTLQKHLHEITHNIQTLAATEDSLCVERDSFGEKLGHLAGEVSRTRQELSDKSSRMKALEDLQQQYEGYYRGVKEVLMEGKKDTLGGICGVVAEIIKVPEQYETAVEVALGSALQYIVTESADDAGKAIGFLKKSRAGRATFLPLDVIKPAPRDNGKTGIAGQKGFCGMAGDLVNYDKKYAKIIEYLLGRVFVVDNIRNATELARAINFSAKIVTLDGDVINPGGSMTGGVYQKGRASLLGRVREIEETHVAVKLLEEMVEGLEKSVSATQKVYDDRLTRIGETQVQLQGLNIDKNSLQKDIEVVLQENARIESTAKLLEDEKQNLENEIQGTDSRIHSQKAHLEVLRLKDGEIRKTIELQQETLLELEEERSGLSETVTQIKVNLAGLRQEEINYAQIMDRVNDAIREIEIQIQKKVEQVKDYDTQRALQDSEIGRHESAIRELSEQKGVGEDLLSRLRNDKQAYITGVAEAEARIKSLSRELAQNKEYIHASDVKRARLEFDIENSLDKLTEELQITYEEALLKKTEIKNKRETAARIKELKEAISLLGNVNIGAIDEFERVKERYDFLTGQYHDLDQAKVSLFKVIDEMDQIMTKRFEETFSSIKRNFTEVFTQLFGGGRAELIMTNGENLLECGIDILAQPPGKKTQHLSLLSGGERALTAISLLFAILKTKPSPFCVLDEIEASLDEVNADRYAVYLKEFAQNTQFVVITHRKRTMEAADILYGVTMDDSGVTKLVSMKLSDEQVGKVS